MKIYAATTADPMPFTEVIGGADVAILPAGTEVSAMNAGFGHWHLNAQHSGSVWTGSCYDSQLQFTGVLATINEGK